MTPPSVRLPADGGHAPWMPGPGEPGLVSVIVPTYNRAEVIRETLDSVCAQDYAPIELLVVDDGSSDSTAQVVSEFARDSSGRRAGNGWSVSCLRQENQGACSARNHGLRAARGEFIQFLDSDDVLHPEKLRRNVEALRQWPQAAFVTGPAFTFTGRFEAGALPGTDSIRFCRGGRNYFEQVDWYSLTPLYRRRLCAAVGPWEEGLKRSQDWEYSVRVALHAGGYVLLDRPLAGIRAERRPDRISASTPADSIVRSNEAAAAAIRSARAAGIWNKDIRWLVARKYYGNARRALEEGNLPLYRETVRAMMNEDPPWDLRAKLGILGVTRVLFGGDRCAGLLNKGRRVVHVLCGRKHLRNARREAPPTPRNA